MKLGLIASTAVLCAASVTASNVEETMQLRQPKVDADSDQTNRNLELDWFTEGEETCLNTDEFGKETYGDCVKEKFPKCEKNESICYNRTNRRDAFWPDGQAKFYINYNRDAGAEQKNDASCSIKTTKATVGTRLIPLASVGVVF
eukprot:scaffold91900_cov59-Attheya_sp.AAC.7